MKDNENDSEIEKSFGTFQKKYFIIFLVILYGLGAIGYIPWVLFSYGLFPDVIYVYFMIIGGTSPFFAALIATRLEHGKKAGDYIFGGFSSI